MNEKETDNKHRKQGNVSLILDSYTDIFSDFDPRAYSERALSDDFLAECKRAARDKELGFELILSVPKNKRKLNDETSIKKRIKEHFKEHHAEKEREIHKIKKNGVRWIIIGSILLITTAILETYSKSFLINLAMVITTPAGWFSFWEGLGKIFIYSREREPEELFYRKMANAKIHFVNY